MNILLFVLWCLYTEFSLGDSSPGPAWERFCGCWHLMAGLGLLGLQWLHFICLAVGAGIG